MMPASSTCGSREHATQFLFDLGAGFILKAGCPKTAVMRADGIGQVAVLVGAMGKF
jgi:hypothetical protein